MALFNQTFEIKGKHADLLRKMTSDKALNCRNIDVLYMSIALGITKQLKAEPDTTSKIEPAKIDSEQMVRFNDDIEYFYRLLMLTDTKYCASAKERCNKAFRYIGTEQAERDELHFIKVLLGGIEFLYDQIMDNTTSKNDIFNNICDFVETLE